MISMKQRVTPRSGDGSDDVVSMEGGGGNDPMDLSAKGEFKLAFVNLGQGECTLIRCPDGAVGMIDCGSRAYFDSGTDKDVKGTVMAEVAAGVRDLINTWTGGKVTSQNPRVDNKNVLDFLILTHCDTDHYSWVQAFITYDIKIAKVYFSGGPNAIGPDSFYKGDTQLYKFVKKESSLSSMGGYKTTQLGTNIMKGNWATTQAVEVVINEKERSTYSYNLGADSKVENPATDKGGSNSRYGNKVDLNGDFCEVITGGSDEWGMFIVSGNVLLTNEVSASSDHEEGGGYEHGNVGQVRKRLAQPGNPASKKNKTYQIEVIVPYETGHPRNTASLCTRINFKNKNGEQEFIQLMGDATNATFEFLNDITSIDDNYVLSNIPHHGSAVHCNDMNSAEESLSADSLKYIQSTLMPRAAIVSCKPGYTRYKFPAMNVVNNYTDIAESLDEGHLFDQWINVPSNGGENIVKTQWEKQNPLAYRTVRKSNENWYYLMDENPPANSFRILCPALGLMLQRIAFNADVKLPILNYNRANGGFKYIYHEFQVF